MTLWACFKIYCSICTFINLSSSIRALNCRYSFRKTFRPASPRGCKFCKSAHDKYNVSKKNTMKRRRAQVHLDDGASRPAKRKKKKKRRKKEAANSRRQQRRCHARTTLHEGTLARYALVVSPAAPRIHILLLRVAAAAAAASARIDRISSRETENCPADYDFSFFHFAEERKR